MSEWTFSAIKKPTEEKDYLCLLTDDDIVTLRYNAKTAEWPREDVLAWQEKPKLPDEKERNAVKLFLSMCSTLPAYASDKNVSSENGCIYIVDSMMAKSIDSFFREVGLNTSCRTKMMPDQSCVYCIRAE